VNLFSASSRRELRVGRVFRMVAEIGAGVAKMRCLNGPNVDVFECSVYFVGVPEIRVIGVDRWMWEVGILEVNAETTVLKPCGDAMV
jgi:hypothetical protein